MDPRYHDLAAVLTGHSTELNPGEKVLIWANDVPSAMVVALIRAIRARGALPFVKLLSNTVTRELAMGAEEAQFAVQSEIELHEMQKMDAFIGLRGANNIFETSDVPGDRMTLAQKLMRPVQDYRVKKTKWVVLRWPTSAMAQQALTSTEAFADFYFKVCTLDYGRMVAGAEALAERMRRTDQVRITGPGTDLRFSIKGIGAVPCTGSRNIPDGEVFSCPVRDSVAGEITYNAPTVYQGNSFDRVHFRFEKGKIVEATAQGDNAKLQSILDADEGARYIGEFALGFNPYILEPMRDILFDEKITGSFHFTPGQAYEDTDNGNRSQVHWDIVCIQRPEYGGGAIYFDDELIRQDGLFMTEDLKPLNPDVMLADA